MRQKEIEMMGRRRGKRQFEKRGKEQVGKERKTKGRG